VKVVSLLICRFLWRGFWFLQYLLGADGFGWLGWVLMGYGSIVGFGRLHGAMWALNQMGSVSASVFGPEEYGQSATQIVSSNQGCNHQQLHSGSEDSV
jgi:hypothetical protein